LYFQDYLYAGSSGIVSCHNPDDYSVIWRNKLKGYGSSYGNTLVPYINPTSHTPCILVGMYSYIICLNAHTGVILWSHSLKNTRPFFVSVCVQDNRIIVGSFGKIFVLNGDEGILISKDNLTGYGS